MVPSAVLVEPPWLRAAICVGMLLMLPVTAQAQGQDAPAPEKKAAAAAPPESPSKPEPPGPPTKGEEPIRPDQPKSAPSVEAPKSAPPVEAPKSAPPVVAPAATAKPPASSLPAKRPHSILRGTKLGGYAEFTFENEEDKNSSFGSLRFVMALHSKISSRISATAEIEFERGGSPEKRAGELHHGEVILEQATVDFEIFEWLVARAGVLLVPFGNFNQLHDAPRQDLADRPISDQLIIPTTWFEAGAGFLGDIQLGGGHELHYEAYFINGLDAKLSDEFGTRAARGSLFEDNNNDKGVVAQLRYRPHPIVDVGLSFYTGDYDLQDNRIWMLGADTMLTFGGFELLFSYAKLFADDGFTEGFAEGSTANTRSAIPTGMHGLFAEARYRLPLRAIMPDDMRSATMAIATRYSQVDMNEDVRSAGDRADLVLGLNFRPVLPAVLKTEVHLLRNGASGDNPSLFNDFFAERPKLRFVASVAYGF